MVKRNLDASQLRPTANRARRSGARAARNFRRLASASLVAATILSVAFATSSAAQDVTAPAPAPKSPAVSPVVSPPTVSPPSDRPSGETTSSRRTTGGGSEGVADAPVAPPLTDAERFRRGQNHFEFGDCKKVVETMQELSVPGRLSNEDRLVETHRMLGVCHFQLGNKAFAEKELKGLLYIKPDYVLDPFLTPPPVVEIFAKLRAEVKRKLAEINAANEPKESLPSIVIEREVTHQDTPLFSIFVPFGGAQALNGEPIKAGILGGLQLAAVAVNAGAFWTAQSIIIANGGSTVFPSDDPNSTTLTQVVNGAHIVAAAALGAWVITYAYSVADGWWNWVPRREISRDEKRRKATKDDAKRLR